MITDVKTPNVDNIPKTDKEIIDLKNAKAEYKRSNKLK